MGMKTGRIKFNVTQRGRKHRGVERKFDTAALASMINGGDVQERVSMGDMHGYYGHWPRVKFGMNPVEGGIEKGKVVVLEPALRTTYIKAMPDGTIEHEAEFLDTDAGKVAARLYASKAGGFSSAIDIRNVGQSQIPTGFYGFDYVLEPNFTTNRGYALDGVSDEEMAVFDEVAEYNGLMVATNRILDSMQSQYDIMAETLAAMELEREELYSMLASGKHKPEVVLDGVQRVVFGSRPSHNPDDFLRESLVGFEKPKDGEKKAENGTDSFLSRAFGI